MGRKTRFFGEKRRLIFPIFRLEKGKKKSDPVEGIGLSFLLVPPNGIEPPTY
jgi:hypothetical protein